MNVFLRLKEERFKVNILEIEGRSGLEKSFLGFLLWNTWILNEVTIEVLSNRWNSIVINALIQLIELFVLAL